jgi:hypothetical protein
MRLFIPQTRSFLYFGGSTFTRQPTAGTPEVEFIKEPHR